MKIYDELAAWWPLMSPPEEYEEEASVFARALIEAADGPVRRVLELGSGGGNNASFMKAHFGMTLVDVSDGMLDVSRALNPECHHVLGDMRAVRLGESFDAVFVHDAVTFMSTEADLKAAMATAAAHCRPGGAVVFVPDFVKETFASGHEAGGVDAEERGFRYLEWTHDPDPSDTTYAVDWVYMLRDGTAPVRVIHEHATEGVFERADWVRWLREANIEAKATLVELSSVPAGAYEMFVGRRMPDRSSPR